jgi:hypothetical protein
MDCKMSTPLMGMMVGYILASFCAPANAVVLFENPFVDGAPSNVWCDPCSFSEPAPNTGKPGGRVWDSFTLAGPSTLQSLRWFGLPSDALTLGVNVQIANAPNTSPLSSLFFAHYDLGSISVLNVNMNTQRRIVSLPDVILSAGRYWLTIYGPSFDEKHTWRGQFEPSGDNSLIQYFGPDPDHPAGFNFRFEDARFRIDGELNPVPLPAALPLYGTGLGVLAFLAWRRKRRAVTAT